jgi:hypothetical protein
MLERLGPLVFSSGNIWRKNLHRPLFGKIKCDPINKDLLGAPTKWRVLEDGNSGLRTAIVCANSW